MSVQFPFPDKENSFPLLQNDPEFRKIPADEVDSVFEHAWEIGVQAAEKLLAAYKPPVDFFEIAAHEQIKIISKTEDNVAANIRFYSEFYPKLKEIYLYDGSIRLWCAANGLSLTNGRMIILSHEFFHYLEHKELGWVSKSRQVYMLKIGSLEIGKTGIAALSEIAANAFAYTCFPYLRIDESAGVEYAEEEKAKPKKKTTFWNRRVNELNEIYNQFFKF